MGVMAPATARPAGGARAGHARAASATPTIASRSAEASAASAPPILASRSEASAEHMPKSATLAGRTSPNQQSRLPLVFGAEDASPAILERWLNDPHVQLMLRVRDGDGQSFDQLVNHYSRRVLSYFRRRGYHLEAEDLTQDVFLRLYRHRHRYQPKVPFASWVFFVARNVARNAGRQQARRCRRLWNEESRHETRQSSAPRSSSVDSPSMSLEREELARVVRSAMAQLDGRKQKALEMYQFGESSCSEVAEALHMTPQGAKSLLHRARRELRQALSAFNSDE